MRVRGFEVVSEYKDKGIELPMRKTKYSAGYDIAAAKTMIIPSIWSQSSDLIAIDGIANLQELVDKALQGSSVEDLMKQYNLRPTLIPTGLKAYMQDDEVLELVIRSSSPLKKGLIMSNSLGIIDKDFHNNPSNEGHMHVQVLNFLPFDVTVEKGEAICQGIFKKYLTTDNDNPGGERTGGLGSTDTTEEKK